MTVTSEILQNAGYQINDLVKQPLITRCVDDVIDGYIKQIFTTPDETDADVIKAVHCLTYILILQRNVIKTRYGSREKTTTASNKVAPDEVEALTITADMYLHKLLEKEGAEAEPVYFDVARIYKLKTLI